MYWHIFVASLCTVHLSVYYYWAGIPSVGDLTSIYCRCRGIPSSLPQLNFYLALSVFKTAGIAQVCLRWCTRFSCYSIPIWIGIVFLTTQPNGVLALSFPLFIHQGIYARHLLGNASAPKADQFGQCVEPLAKVALQLVKRLVVVIIWFIWINALISELK